MIKAPKNTFKYTVFATDFGVYDYVKNFVGCTIMFMYFFKFLLWFNFVYIFDLIGTMYPFYQW